MAAMLLKKNSKKIKKLEYFNWKYDCLRHLKIEKSTYLIVLLKSIYL